MERSITEMEFRFLKSRSLRYAANGLVILLLLTGCVICFLGQTREHTGWLAIESTSSAFNPNSTAQKSSFYGRIKNENPIFRGNDLFYVRSPVIHSQQKILGEDWDTQFGRGKVFVTLEQPLASREPLPVTYRLSVRWLKIIPFFVMMLTVILGIWFCFKIHVYPELINNRRAIAVARLVCLLAVGTVIYLNLSHSGWMYGDDHFMLSSTVQGDLLHTTIFPSTGRFFPLGLIDLNLMIPFGDSPFAYNLERTLMFLLVMVVIYLATQRTVGPLIACILVTVLVFSPHMIRIYSVSIFPESRLILLLALFFLGYYRADETGRGWLLLLSCAAASLATYFKEPVFGLFVVFALTQLLFGYTRLSNAQRWANLYLLFNGAVFLSFYWWYCSGGGNYADQVNDGSITSLGLLGSYFLKPFLTFAVICGLWRAYEIIILRDRGYLKYDGALYAGLAYAMAFVLLKLNDDYYLIPTYVCCIFAFSGYLADIRKRIANQPASASPEAEATGKSLWTHLMEPRVQLATFLGVIIISAVINIPKSILDLNTTHGEREVTTQLTQLFAELNSEGFEIYTYTPQEMSPHSQMLQKYRRTVINIFDFNAQNRPADADVWKHLPVQELKEASPPGPEAKIVVLHDIKYSIDGLNSQRPVQDQVELVGSVPAVMGVRVFTKPEFHAKIQRIVNHPETSLY